MKTTNRTPARKLAKTRGQLHRRAPPTAPVDQDPSLAHPFPNYSSFPETNAMVMNPFHEMKVRQDLEGFVGHSVAPSPPATLVGAGTPQSPTADTETSFSKYLETHLERSLGAMDARFRTRNKRLPLSRATQFLSAEDAIRYVNQREYNLVSIDNEFYERSTEHVIEVGVSIYRPAFQKHALFPSTTNFHFIVRETLPLRNGVFVPDSKMSNITGESYVIGRSEVPKALDAIFEHLGPKTLIVGHSVKGDLDSFKDFNWTPPLLGVVDTTTLWFSLFGSNHIKSRLGYVLDKLGVPHAYLHNAVNDAYYTLVACLMLCSTDLRNNLKMTVVPEVGAESSASESDVDADADGDTSVSVSDSDSEVQSINMAGMTLQSSSETDLSTSTSTEPLAQAPSLAPTSIINKAKPPLKKKTRQPRPAVRLRGDISDEAIDRKFANDKKLLNPRSNYFFKPVKFSHEELLRRLNELTL